MRNIHLLVSNKYPELDVFETLLFAYLCNKYQSTNVPLTVWRDDGVSTLDYDSLFNDPSIGAIVSLKPELSASFLPSIKHASEITLVLSSITSTGANLEDQLAQFKKMSGHSTLMFAYDTKSGAHSISAGHGSQLHGFVEYGPLTGLELTLYKLAGQVLFLLGEKSK